MSALVTCCTVAGNDIRGGGGIALAAALRSNASLTTLDVSGENELER